MADLRWMKFWVRDYLGDTGHLSLAEHGAYLKLLCLAWDNPHCAIPSDPKWIKRRLGVDEAMYRDVVCPVLEEFWEDDGEWLSQKRQRKEWTDAKESAHRRSKAGKKGSDARWKANGSERKDFYDA